MNLDRSLAESDIDTEKQRYAKKIDHHFEKNYKTSLRIPEGYEVQKLPERQFYESDDYGFEISHELNDREIVMKKRIYVKTLVVDINEFSQWNEFIKTLVKAYKKSITLKKIS